METLEHFMISLGVAGILIFFADFFGYGFMGSTTLLILINGLVIVLVGIFMDIDHVLAVGIVKKTIPFNFKKLKEECASFGKTEYPLILFHTIEFVLLLAFVSTIFSYYIVLIAVLVHLLVDYIDEPWRFKVHAWLSYNLAHYIKREKEV